MSILKILTLSALIVTSHARASVIYTLSIDLSPLHSGTFLYGSTTLSNPVPVGDSTPIDLFFCTTSSGTSSTNCNGQGADLTDYNPTSIAAMLSIGSGTSQPETIRFSPFSFTNTANTTAVNLMVEAPAQCSGVGCTAQGKWQDNDPASFTGNYTAIQVAGISVPEPGYLPLLSLLLIGMIGVRRVAFR